MPTIRRQPEPPSDIDRLAKEYSNAKAFAEQAQERADALKKMLLEIVTQHGTSDDKGNLWMDAGDYELKKERRITRTLNSDALETWAKEKGYWGEVSEVVEVIREDLVLTLGFEHPELSNDIASFYSEKEGWAFKLKEKKS